LHGTGPCGTMYPTYISVPNANESTVAKNLTTMTLLIFIF
jgi:hypothetical protein